MARTLIAGVNSGYLWTSADSGTSWTQRWSSLTWFSVASSSNGAKLYAVGGCNSFSVSSDYGVSWAYKGSCTGKVALACSADGSKVVIVDGMCYGYVFNYNTTAMSVDVKSQVTSSCGAMTNGGGFSAVATSGDAQVQVGVQGYGPDGASSPGGIYISKDSGATWAFQNKG